MAAVTDELHLPLQINAICYAVCKMAQTILNRLKGTLV